MQLGAALLIIWLAGLFGLMTDSSGNTTGGLLGQSINNITSMFFNISVSAFIYILLIIITILFVLRISPMTIINKIRELSQRDNTEIEQNVKIMKKPLI